LRFPEFEGEWEHKTLIEVADVYDGTHQTPDYVDKGIRFVSVEDISNKDVTPKYITEEAFNKYFKIKPQVDDILMTRITAGIIGATLVIKTNEPLAYYVSLALIRKKERINSEYLSCYINSSYFKRELDKRIIHIAFPKKINLEDLRKCKISLAKLEEQAKIAMFLSLLDERIATQSKIIEQYKSLIKGMSEKLFSQKLRFKDDNGNDYPDWEIKKLGDISTITTGASNREDSILDGSFIFFDRSQDIRTSNRYLFDKEAIIIPGEGQEFTPKYYIGKFDLHQRTYAIFDFKESQGKYVYYYISYNNKYFLSQAVGSTVKSLRLPMFQSMPISLPCIEEQTLIADFLLSIEEKIETEKQFLEQIKNQKKYLLSQMFI